ncbi:RNF10-like protein [Mya arenaria]|uniref:E3 ubiquitin-protein ligase RNF10 n=1 Tax=Mya arenaria TaxID=6604 RepID=A0ABY7E3I0_MYAAR|nr:RNF10-like protein [Mya arenaria]
MEFRNRNKSNTVANWSQVNCFVVVNVRGRQDGKERELSSIVFCTEKKMCPPETRTGVGAVEIVQLLVTVPTMKVENPLLRSSVQLEEEELSAEYGSAIQTGSKKGNLNHLLNFTYEHAVPSSQGRGGNFGYSSGRQMRYRNTYTRNRKLYYNKEQFLQANCHFVVREKGDYSVHMMDPDTLVDWGAVEQVRVIDSEAASCPICLQYPVAAKMTRCGHIYCWACILHYLALGEKTWRKCPICYESIHSEDLKSVSCREVSKYKIGDEISMTLMKKEKGSIYAVPANLWNKCTGKCHNVRESADMTNHCKLLTATPNQVLEILDMERRQLLMQLVDAEPSEEPFIKGAQDQLKARELKLLGVQEAPFEVQPAEEPTITTSEAQIDMHIVKPLPDDRPASERPSADSSITDEPSQTQSPMQVSPSRTPGAEAEPEMSLSPLHSPTATQQPVEMIPDFMPVEEAAEQLELPSHPPGPKQRNKSGDNAFYFYQAQDGQHIYLHSLNARCLVREYGCLEHCPQTITATIMEKESVFVTEELRKRLRYLSHLPLTCGFEVAELALKPPLVNKDTLKHFQEDIDKRRRQRQRRAKDDKRRARYIEEQERKQMGLGTGTIVHSQFQQQQFVPERLGDNCSDTSSPLLNTPVGSPSVHSSEDFPTSQSPADDGQTACVSFAQMLKAGSKSSTVWPKGKADQEKSPISLGSGRVGSDESDNEDKVPVPQYNTEVAAGGPKSGKKKKKQLMLFSTSMARK